MFFYKKHCSITQFFQGILAKMKEGAETALAKAESVLKQGADHFKGMV